ncbi:hypothetical protein F993_00489 [Acinetobacter proteolyticus]|uniref:KAP NTPase domain-containing protein n=1 Tax=Acinetobacter proteolyticus TaxID=1776741 RepID=A0ABN0JIM8_9GAMM|nr:P-loop NTPase fold protein [Acinetobacter proteolyticus]ENU25099.1 hypothetical protein F993_00489 [Acinetobacter proteolyticus]
MNIAANTEDTSYKFIKDISDNIETPFENDFWGREALADRLTDHVSRITVGATIAIDAEWGAGKSWFVKNWKAKLEQDEYKVIYLNAFNQDYIDDPFLTISMEIANCLQSDKTNIDEIKKTIGNAHRAILPNLPMLLWYLTTSLVGMGALAKPVAEAVEKLTSADDFGKEAATLLNEKLQEHLSAQVENYDKEKESLEYFKQALAEITSKLDKPLLFVVDELDRCKPEFAIRLIERIKHFFDIPKVVFILAVNKNQLEESISNYYGFSSTNNYLEKFIDFSIMLKIKDLDGTRYLKILENYNKNYKLDLDNNELYVYTKLCKIYNPTPRQLIRLINKFSLFKKDFDDEKKLFLFLFLIYIELNILKEYSETDFCKHFLEIHQRFYRKQFTENNNDIRPLTTKFCDFLFFSIYSINGKTQIFRNLLYFLESSQVHSPEKRQSKIVYYPTDDVSIDLMEAWHKYIYMIEA